MSKTLVGATLTINNEVVAYEPESLKFKMGKPTRKPNPQVIGGGAVVNAPTEDFSEAFSGVTFDLRSTVENKRFVNTWTENFDQNAISITAQGGDVTVFENSMIINDPEIDTGSDGVISVEINGNQAV